VADCSVCDKALAESKAALVLAEAKIKALEADKATCAAQLAELKKQQAATLTLQADNESLKKKLSEVEERVSELELQLGAGDKSAELNAEINRLKEEIKKKDNQINGCNLLADKCTKKTVELEAKLATSEKDRALLNTQYEDLKRQIVTMDEDMGKLGEIIKTNNAEISKLNAEMGGLRTRLKDCETKLNAAIAPKEESPN
jgi:chromosome segregation ATPase